jgi:hypothetical protein
VRSAAKPPNLSTQTFLAIHADFRHDEVTAIARDLRRLEVDRFEASGVDFRPP